MPRHAIDAQVDSVHHAEHEHRDREGADIYESGLQEPPVGTGRCRTRP